MSQTRKSRRRKSARSDGGEQKTLTDGHLGCWKQELYRRLQQISWRRLRERL